MKIAIVAVLLLIGFGFSFTGALGIVRMPDLYTRIQCSTKSVTMGALPALLALVIGEGVLTSYASRALIVAFLLAVVSPIASHALSRAAYKAGIPMYSGSVVDEVAAEVADEVADERQAAASPPKEA